jgi:hypothetical protein
MPRDVLDRQAGLMTELAGAVLVVGAALPSARPLAWVVLTPHRVRTGCAEARVHSRRGRLPMVLITRRRPNGERVWLWCVAGTSDEDLESARDLLANACWAREVRIVRNPRHPHIVGVDVIRRALPAPAQLDGHTRSAPLLVRPRATAENGPVQSSADARVSTASTAWGSTLSVIPSPSVAPIATPSSTGTRNDSGGNAGSGAANSAAAQAR